MSCDGADFNRVGVSEVYPSHWDELLKPLGTSAVIICGMVMRGKSVVLEKVDRALDCDISWCKPLSEVQHYMHYPAIKSTAMQPDTRPDVQISGDARHGPGRYPDAGDELYLLDRSCHLSEEGWMQDGVCDVLRYSSTENPCMQAKTFMDRRVCGDDCGDSDMLCS